MGIFEIKIIRNPEFGKAQKVHDWRNYVPQELIDRWFVLTLREKQIIFHFANEQAQNEEWD